MRSRVSRWPWGMAMGKVLGGAPVFGLMEKASRISSAVYRGWAEVATMETRKGLAGFFL